MHNEDEDIARTLKQLSSKGGFSVPPGYFNRLKLHVTEQTTRAESNEDNPGLKVPEHYFEQSRERILARTTGNKTSSKPVLQVWYKRNITRYAAAAVVILTASIVLFVNNKQRPSFTAMKVSDEEIMQYLEYTDLREMQVTDVSFAATDAGLPVTSEEQYIINQTDEQSIIEEL